MLILQCLVTMGMVSYFYKTANLYDTKINDPTYTFGSQKEKFISCLDASLAFDSILIIFSIIVLVAIRKKWLTWHLSIVFAIYFSLFFFGKGMAGGFYLEGTTNLEIHDGMKLVIDVYTANNMTLPDFVVAWQYSYYTMIASVLGELAWVLGSSVILIIEGRKVFHATVLL